MTWPELVGPSPLRPCLGYICSNSNTHSLRVTCTVSLYICACILWCVCTRVCTCMYKPEDNLGCHPQEGCPPPLRQGLIGLQPTHKTRQRGPPVFTPLALRVQVCTTMPDIFTRVLGIELWSSLTIEAILGALWHIFTTSETSAGWFYSIKLKNPSQTFSCSNRMIESLEV